MKRIFLLSQLQTKPKMKIQIMLPSSCFSIHYKIVCTKKEQIDNIDEYIMRCALLVI